MSALRKIIGQGIQKAVDTVLPPRCIVTGDIVDMPGMVSPQVWRDLRFISAPQCRCCGVPFDFAAGPGGDDLTCASCLTDRPAYQEARAAMVYDDASRELILKFKHADHTHAVLAFLPWLNRAGADMLARADMIVPVPLHRFRLLKRRYNQAAIIAQALARQTGVPYNPLALARHRSTKTQGHLGYKDRRKNVRDAFTVSPSGTVAIEGKRVLLVDDVYTTGATISECTKTLLKAGAAAVDVLTVARVVRPEPLS